MPKASIDILTGMLRRSDRCLEWGAGHSTAWFVRRTASVLSIEHDPEWYERVRLEVAAVGGDPASVRLVSAEVSGDPAAAPYVRVVDEFAETGIDVCLVDAEHRPECMLAVIPRLNVGGLLVLDDSQLFLDRTAVADAVQSHNGHRPQSGQLIHGGLTPQWDEVAGMLQDWRVVWCSDGASDAAIWIKPSSA